MACWWLRARRERVLRVAMPGINCRQHVATHTPAELADLFASRRALTDAERLSLDEDCLRIRRDTGLLRQWEDGRIIGAPIDRYEPWLLDVCAPLWTPASRVVGTAVGRCGERNAMRMPPQQATALRAAGETGRQLETETR